MTKKLKHWRSGLTPIEKTLVECIDEEIKEVRDKLSVLLTTRRRIANTAAVRLLRRDK